MRSGGYPGTTVISEKTWRKLPKDVQDAIMEASRTVAASEGERWDELHKVVREEFRTQGIEIYDLTPEQRTEWAKALDGLGEEYIAQMESRGFSKIRKVFDDYKATAARIAK